jgi:hypothetical protein
MNPVIALDENLPAISAEIISRHRKEGRKDMAGLIAESVWQFGRSASIGRDGNPITNCELPDTMVTGAASIGIQETNIRDLEGGDAVAPDHDFDALRGTRRALIHPRRQ